MKRILLLLLLLCLISSLSFANLKDGIYSVEKKTETNYISFVKITVKNDKVIGVQYDKKTENGQLFSLNNEKFRVEVLNTGRNYVKNQNFSEINDSIFKELMNFLLKKAENGEKGNFKK